MAEARQPFDLAEGPLLRARLLRLAEEEHIALLVMHHIIADGWSMGVLIGEVAALYEALSAGRASPLPELPIQYVDFALWQREWLRGEALERHLAYWEQQLGGHRAVLELPTDRPRPRLQTSRGATYSFVLSKRLVERLKALSHQEGVTLFMTLLAAFQILLYRYSGQEEIRLGSPIANRNRAEIEDLIGFFVNTLVLRTDLSGNPSFRELLKRVREVTLGAYAHQDLPFEMLVEKLRPERQMNHSPLFQVVFALNNAPVESIKLPGLSFSPLEINTGTAKFDLTLLMAEEPEGLDGVLEYNTDLFDAATIARLATHFQTLLAAVITNPRHPIATLPLLTEQERHQLLVEWNRTRTAYPAHSTIDQLFEAQAELTPDAIALVCEDLQLSYRELNERANQLAHFLRRLGVGPETVVALCLERSVEMVIGLLAILKAGGAYLPLDPAYPLKRLALILEETSAPVLLTQQRLAAGLSEERGARSEDGDAQSSVLNPQCQVVCLDSDWQTIAGESRTNPASSATAEQLAYVCYTSGSTGRPKGVSILHRNVVRLVKETNYVQLGPQEVFLQLAPISFDASTFELWGSLLSGARLVVMPAGTASLEELGEALKRYQVTTLWLTAGLFHQMVEAQAESLRRVRQLLAGGDVLSVTAVRKYLDALGAGRLINGYGPTESTTFTCCYAMDASSEFGSGVPIGRPISNTQVYLLDDHLNPAPVGVVGEIYIGGDGLARGYFRQPELTAERFIPHPFSAEAGERLYRSGDLARYLADGRIEFVGRGDEQVKVRGYRIELGEVEAALAQHPGVRAVAVTAREGVGGEKRLVAYVVSERADVPRIGELRGYLQEHLPGYMVPSDFVRLDALPLTPHGKVDRRALPAPKQTRPELASAFIAPRTPVEEVLAEIWAEVLSLDAVGIDDNFFDLGGHSLLATKVVSRVREAFQVDLPLRHLFESPTVATLAERIEKMVKTGPALQAPPIERVSRDKTLLLSFAQQRLWFIDQLEPGNPSYNIPLALRLTGWLDVTALERSLNEILRRHESLRTIFASVDGQPVQVIIPAGWQVLPVVDLSECSEQEREAQVRRLATEEASRPFDLARGPLFRACLLRLGEQEHIVLCTLHHIVSDEWSLGVMVRELGALYAAFCHDQSSPLVELPIQYADFAHWQRQWLQGEVLESQLTYWRQQLGGQLTVLKLPSDRPRPMGPTYRGALHSFAVSAEVSSALKALSRQEGITLFMTLLSALLTLLHRESGQDDIIVGTDVANRNRLETEGLIGFFVNHLVLRTDLSGNPSFRQLLKRVREVTLGAYAHQDLPFDKLVGALHLERSASHPLLFQVLFVFGNPTLPELEWPGLRLSPLGSDQILAKYDLTLFISARAPEISGSWRYNVELFEAATVARLSARFETLLDSIAANPDARLSTLELLSEAERQQQAEEKRGREEARMKKLTNVSRKAIDLPPTNPVKIK
jgi:amino acid adenylation domain-containing protein